MRQDCLDQGAGRKATNLVNEGATKKRLMDKQCAEGAAVMREGTKQIVDGSTMEKGLTCEVRGPDRAACVVAGPRSQQQDEVVCLEDRTVE